LTGIPNTLLPLIKAFIIKFVTKKKRERTQLNGLEGKKNILKFTRKVSYFSLIIQLQDYDSNQRDLKKLKRANQVTKQERPLFIQ
jgi:hypothetical protein